MVEFFDVAFQSWGNPSPAMGRLASFPPTKGVDSGKHSKGDHVRFVLEFLLLIIVSLIVPSGVP